MAVGNEQVKVTPFQTLDCAWTAQILFMFHCFGVAHQVTVCPEEAKLS